MQGRATTFRSFVSAFASSFNKAPLSSSSSSVCRRLRQQQQHKLWGLGSSSSRIVVASRGGGYEQQQQQQQFRYNSQLAASISVPDESTSSASSASPVNDDTIDKKQIAQDSIGLMGSSIKKAIFGGGDEADNNNGIEYYDTSNMNEFRVLFVLGGPGAGKGTQSELLEENYPCVHLSAGELLREEAKNKDSIHSKLINERLVAGQIVPVEISLSLLQQAMKKAASEKGDSLIFLIDGFPRNFDNLDGWVRCMTTSDGSSSNNDNDSDNDDGVASVWGVLTYACPLDELERRILSRAETSGRSDDNIKSAQKRFHTFEKETMPVVDTIQLVQQLQEEEQNKQGDQKRPSLKVVEISADKSVDDVWVDTQQIMNTFIKNDILTANSKLLSAIINNDVETYVNLCSEDMLLSLSSDDDNTETTKKGGSKTNNNNIIMEHYEGAKMAKLSENDNNMIISNPSIEFITGTKAKVSYDCNVISSSQEQDEEESLLFRETRVWSYEGSRGWVNIHFYRTPISPV